MTYWIYRISIDTVKTFIAYNTDKKLNIFGFRTNNNITKNDIVFLYEPNKRQGGFIGSFKIISPLELNSAHIILKDNRLQKFIAKIKDLKIFDPIIKLKTIEENYTKNLTLTLTDISSYNTTFIKDLKKCIRGIIHTLSKAFTEDGVLLYNILLKITKQYKLNSENETKIETKKINEDDSISRDESSDASSDESSDASSDESSDESIGSSSDSIIKESSNEFKSDYIPILIIPCTKLDKKNFLNHYLDCIKCDTTNNNPFEFKYLYEKSKKNIKIKYNIVEEADITDKLSALDEMTVLNLTKSVLNIYLISDVNSSYDDCIIIA